MVRGELSGPFSEEGSNSSRVRMTPWRLDRRRSSCGLGLIFFMAACRVFRSNSAFYKDKTPWQRISKKGSSDSQRVHPGQNGGCSKAKLTSWINTFRASGSTGIIEFRVVETLCELGSSVIGSLRVGGSCNVRCEEGKQKSPPVESKLRFNSEDTEWFWSCVCESISNETCLN